MFMVSNMLRIGLKVFFATMEALTLHASMLRLFKLFKAFRLRPFSSKNSVESSSLESIIVCFIMDGFIFVFLC